MVSSKFLILVFRKKIGYLSNERALRLLHKIFFGFSRYFYTLDVAGRCTGPSVGLSHFLPAGVNLLSQVGPNGFLRI